MTGGPRRLGSGAARMAPALGPGDDGARPRSDGEDPLAQPVRLAARGPGRAHRGAAAPRRPLAQAPPRSRPPTPRAGAAAPALVKGTGVTPLLR
ncbi:hypothetical protein ACF090_18375, partial [Streptomyces sp. NPDC014892]